MAIERKFRVIYPDNFNFQKVYLEVMENLPYGITVEEINPPEAKNLKEPIELKRTLTDLDIQKYRELLGGGRR
jgi:hypothetical protein